jgi:PKD domain
VPAVSKSLLLVALVAASCLAAGCTDKLSLNKATLDDPSFSVSPTSGGADTTFHVDAGSLSKYNLTWDFGDGTHAYGASADHRYGFSNGHMTITLIATDSTGKQGIATQSVELGNGVNSPPTVRLSADRTWVKTGAASAFTAFGYDSDGDPLTYTWTVQPPGGKELLAADGPGTLSTSFDNVGAYTVKVLAKDPKGGTATDTQVVWATKEIPPTTYDATYFGNLTAGNADAGVNEKLDHAAGGAAPNQTVDSAVYPFTLDYPGYGLVFLTWNDSSGAGAEDLDLELRYAGNGTTVWASAHHLAGPPDPNNPPPVPPPVPPNPPTPPGPYEYNASRLDAGAYEVVVRGYTGANVAYSVLIHASLQVSPEQVAKSESGPA